LSSVRGMPARLRRRSPECALRVSSSFTGSVGEHEKCALCGLRLHWIHAQLDPFEWCRGGWPARSRPQQFQKRFAVEATAPAAVNVRCVSGAGFEMQVQAQLKLVGQPGAWPARVVRPFSRRASKEFERLQQLYRIFQLELFFKPRRLFSGVSLRSASPRRQLAQL